MIGTLTSGATQMATTANDTLTWRRIEHDLVFSSPLLHELVALWDSRLDGDRLPGRRRSRFDALELLRFRGHVALIDVSQDPERYRFRLIGTRITEMLGRDLTGRYLDEIYKEERYDTVVEGYRYCIAHRRPAKARGQMVHANKEHILFESVDLPLADDGRTVNMIIKGATFPRMSP